LPEDSSQCSDRHVDAELTGYRHQPRLRRVPKLTVTALLSDLHPAIPFQFFDQVA